jgi:hypothetical protein
MISTTLNELLLLYFSLETTAIGAHFFERQRTLDRKTVSLKKMKMRREETNANDE